MCRYGSIGKTRNDYDCGGDGSHPLPAFQKYVASVPVRFLQEVFLPGEPLPFVGNFFVSERFVIRFHGTANSGDVIIEIYALFVGENLVPLCL